MLLISILLYKTVIQNFIVVLRSMIMSGQFTKKLIIISFKLKTLRLYIWSLHSCTIKCVFKKKSEHTPKWSKEI